MGKECIIICSKCKTKHYFPANSNKRQTICTGSFKNIVNGQPIYSSCGNTIHNKGWCKETHTPPPRLKMRNMKYGEQTTLKGDR